MPRRRSCFWSYPHVRFGRCGRYAVIDYDMWGTGNRMSEEALGQLSSFVLAYYKAHRPRTKRAESLMGPTSGPVEVLPEHADEMAARILVHITDERNFDTVLRAELMKYGPEAREDEEETRAMVAEKWPKLLDDPLGTVPGSEQGDGLDRLCRLR